MEATGSKELNTWEYMKFPSMYFSIPGCLGPPGHVADINLDFNLARLFAKLLEERLFVYESWEGFQHEGW